MLALMYRLSICSIIAFTLALSSAWAQAPAEERRAYGNPLSDTQQRVEFSRQASVNADRRAMRAELELQQIDHELREVQKHLDAIRTRQDKAKKELAEARSAAAAARKDFDRESAALERMRQGQARP
jgi:chromosome segregation ATPase